MFVAEDSTGSCSSNGSGRASLPNEMQISCKRLVKTYVPYRLKEPWESAELRLARVCRLHLRVRPLPRPDLA